MTPGTASQPPDDVVSLSWNKQGTNNYEVSIVVKWSIVYSDC